MKSNFKVIANALIQKYKIARGQIWRSKVTKIQSQLEQVTAGEWGIYLWLATAVQKLATLSKT